jgi:hypothetical protein
VLPSLSCATLVEVAPSKFGGLGLMAKRNFEAGDVILVEAPFLSVRSRMLTKTLHSGPLGIYLTINLLAFHRCLKLSGRISRTPSAIPRPPPHTSANLSQSSIPPVGVYVYVSESSWPPRPSPLFYKNIGIRHIFTRKERVLPMYVHICVCMCVRVFVYRVSHV